MKRARPKVPVIVSSCLLVLVARCDGVLAEDAVPDAARWGFFLNLGAGGVQGGLDEVLTEPLTGDFGIQREKGPWRFGLGVSFGSFAMRPPYGDEPEWGFQRIFLAATRTLPRWGAFRPYLQARLGVARLHPRSELFALDPLPEDFAIGDSPTPAYNGFHLGVVPGVEWQFSPDVALDVSVLFDYFRVGDVDLSPIGQSSASASFDWQARMGMQWWNGGGSGRSPAPPDAWGIRPSYGWAFGEALAINYGAAAMNEYVRNANFNQVSPRSWWSNLQEGFTYDDNDFSTNQFIHPFNGSQYYNAARSNGLSFWPSYAVALTGALHWELAGETHPMSFNDLVSTGVGGAAMGEVQYRFSSMMLDNSATGARRFLREAASFVIDPIRGFNRIVSGRAWKVRANPASAMDTNPVGQHNRLDVGWRRVGNEGTLVDETIDSGFLEYRHSHGNVFDNPRRGPFDYFTFDGRLHFGDKTAIGHLMLHGNWWTAPVGEYEQTKHMAAIVQHFEYINSEAYEYGGQSVGPSFFSRWGSAGPITLETRFDLMGTILGAVNADYSDSATVADPERLREYDYGPGGGGNALLRVAYKGHRVLSASYRLHFLQVTNGSIFQIGDIGVDARHWLHGADIRFDTPTVSGWGLGAQYTTFTRESHYKITAPELDQLSIPGISISQLIEQSSTEWRIYLSYFPSP